MRSDILDIANWPWGAELGAIIVREPARAIPILQSAIFEPWSGITLDFARETRRRMADLAPNVVANSLIERSDSGSLGKPRFRRIEFQTRTL